MPANTTMNLNEFHKQLADAPPSFRRRLRDYLRRPTERNACYLTGYVAALGDAHLFKTGNAASYWVALISRTEGNDALGRELINAMDNPLEVFNTLEQAESRAHICAKLAEEHKDDAALFAALTDAAAIIRDLMRELRRETERRWRATGVQKEKP